MTVSLSRIGEKLSRKTGILELMDDLGKAMSEGGMNMLGGGNPAAVPQMEAIWRNRMLEILSSERDFEAMLGNYDTPQGRPKFISALVKLLNTKFSWNLTEKNVAITNGSQNAFLYIFNMLAGEFSSGEKKKILLPIAPEYIGYADQGLCDDIFIASKPIIEELGPHAFKYGVDFKNLRLDKSIAAVALSRPTNPTGNVMTEEEIRKLVEITKSNGSYLCIDNAYGTPFPNAVFSEITLPWDDHVIHSFSLSKIGLPGARNGVVVANEEIIAAISAINAVTSLASGNVGQELVAPLLLDGRLTDACQKYILPFYKERLEQAQSWCSEFFPDNLPYSFHRCDGAFFLWLWCKDLPITSKELYQRLKKRKTLVVPGHYFFFGLEEPWQHTHECIRMNYSQSPAVVKEGLKIIADEVTRAYEGS
jgi:valine--pyruvate aminotransferase